MDTRNTTQSLDTFEKVERLWYHDGDVVLCAVDNKFCVHSEKLSAESTVFRDMIARVPQDHSEGEVWVTPKTKNVSFRVIYLRDSNNRDIFSFLSAIFKPDFYEPPPKVYPYFMTANILRLAEKYDTPALMQRALAHLDALLPMNQRALKWIADRESDSPVPNYTMLRTYLDLLPVVGRISHIKWLIPSIVYLIINLLELPDLMKYEPFVRLALELRVMIVKCGINHVRDQESIDSCAGMIPSLEACGNDSVEIGTSFRWNCQVIVEKYIEQSREGFWNKHVELCHFKTWDEAREMRTKALKL